MTARTRRILTIGLMAIALAAIASPAAAGGWWGTSPQLEERANTLAVGESTMVAADVMFRSTEEADAARTSGDYYAYLVRGIDEEGLRDAMSQSQPETWWTKPDVTIQLGRLIFGGQDSNLVYVSAMFTVPDVDHGIYDLMFCDLGCSEAMANVVPLRSVYVGDPATVRLLRDRDAHIEYVNGEVQHLKAGIDRAVLSIESVGDDVEAVDARTEETVEELRSIDTSLAALEQRVDALSTSQPAQTTTPRWVPAGWFVAGVALAGLWVNRRRDHTDEDDDLDLDGATDEPDHREEAELPEPEFITLG